jgi:hypothetical protein
VNPKKNCENFEFINFQKSLAHSVCWKYLPKHLVM